MNFLFESNAVVKFKVASGFKKIESNLFMKYFTVDNFKSFEMVMDLNSLDRHDQKRIDNGELPIAYMYYWMSIINEINKFECGAFWVNSFKKIYYDESVDQLLDLMMGNQIWENFEGGFCYVWGDNVMQRTLFRSVNECDGIIFPSHGGDGITFLLNEKSLLTMKQFLP